MSFCSYRFSCGTASVEGKHDHKKKLASHPSIHPFQIAGQSPALKESTQLHKANPSANNTSRAEEKKKGFAMI